VKGEGFRVKGEWLQSLGFSDQDHGWGSRGRVDRRVEGEEKEEGEDAINT